MVMFKLVGFYSKTSSENAMNPCAFIYYYFFYKIRLPLTNSGEIQRNLRELQSGHISVKFLD